MSITVKLLSRNERTSCRNAIVLCLTGGKYKRHGDLPRTVSQFAAYFLVPLNPA